MAATATQMEAAGRRRMGRDGRRSTCARPSPARSSNERRRPAPPRPGRRSTRPRARSRPAAGAAAPDPRQGRGPDRPPARGRSPARSARRRASRSRLRASRPCDVDVHVRRRRGAKARRADPMESRRPARASSASRRPIGIVGAISPFNFPFVAHKLALRPGRPVSSPRARRRLVLLLAELEQEAGLPAGANVLVGPASAIGDVLVEDERVKPITFTPANGGTQRAARKRVKPPARTFPHPRCRRRPRRRGRRQAPRFGLLG